jgi:hypothetical protein
LIIFTFAIAESKSLVSLILQYFSSHLGKYEFQLLKASSYCH